MKTNNEVKTKQQFIIRSSHGSFHLWTISPILIWPQEGLKQQQLRQYTIHPSSLRDNI